MTAKSNDAHPLTIAMVGTRGVPAAYGGFETAIEEVGQRLVARGHRVRVYSRRRPGVTDEPASYKGMELVWHGALKKRSLETLSHSALSVQHLVRNRTDVAFVFNSANAPFLPLLRAARIPVATHVDGLEWKRGKWGPAGQKYYRVMERGAVWFSDALIADAQGIQDYYWHKFDKSTDLISYGAPKLDDIGSDRLGLLDLSKNSYHLVVARFEPENHVAEIVEGYSRSEAKKPLIVVGTAPYGDEYIARVLAAAHGDSRVHFLGGVWDQELLDQLYANAFTYLHGHSVGGTNPSLLRAIGASAPVIAYNVNFNHEVLGKAGEYFSTAHDVSLLVEQAEWDVAFTNERRSMSRVRADSYDWDLVADGYESLARRLASRRQEQVISK